MTYSEWQDWARVNGRKPWIIAEGDDVRIVRQTRGGREQQIRARVISINRKSVTVQDRKRGIKRYPWTEVDQVYPQRRAPGAASHDPGTPRPASGAPRDVADHITTRQRKKAKAVAGMVAWAHSLMDDPPPLLEIAQEASERARQMAVSLARRQDPHFGDPSEITWDLVVDMLRVHGPELTTEDA